jgi:hypothetical protein
VFIFESFSKYLYVTKLSVNCFVRKCQEVVKLKLYSELGNIMYKKVRSH